MAASADGFSAPAAAAAAHPVDAFRELADFTATTRMLQLSVVALGLGVISAGLSMALLALIAFFTNVFFHGTASLAGATPADAVPRLGGWMIAIPIVGGLVIGVMARFGSERIRGHGIPEAIESILVNGSRVEPKLAILKPVSAAISIGSGGPFGAEGPIIMTGGAVGSLVGQLLHMTSAERKTLLVAGAAAGMSATFGTPLAAILLSVELLLFEWKPRSFVPVALASLTALVARRHILGAGALFPVSPHPLFLGWTGIGGCLVAGLGAGVLSLIVTRAVYAAEDAFDRLPLHWMWWPALGGLAVGIGGWLYPPALGVGYDVIGALLQGRLGGSEMGTLLVVKAAIWSIALGSGTSGGVLAPLLMMGAALGGIEAHWLPDYGPGFWAIVGMAAVLGGAMRVPLTAVIFALELTHDFDMLVPLALAVTIAYACTVLLLRRSILTEKVSRRGFHLSREYEVDALEIVFVREAMQRHVVALPEGASIDAIRDSHRVHRPARAERLYPVVGDAGQLVGVVTRQAIDQWAGAAHERIESLARARPVVAYPDEPLRAVAMRMAQTGVSRLPVVERGPVPRLAGLISLTNLLEARRRTMEAEQRRERVISMDVGPLIRRAVRAARSVR